MHRALYTILLALLLIPFGKTQAQDTREEIRVYFRVGKAVTEKEYANNQEQLSYLQSLCQEIEEDSTLTLTSVQFYGWASPEGNSQINRKIAHKRRNTLEKMVRGLIAFPDSIVTRDKNYIAWDYLREQVEASDLPRKQKILDILDLKPRLVKYDRGGTIDHRILKLKKLNRGKIWKKLHKMYFKKMRNACVVLTVHKHLDTEPIIASVPPVMLGAAQPSTHSIARVELPAMPAQQEEWTRHIHVKTNALGWGLAIGNVAGEIDITKHWSFALPIYYSALNYFTPDIKFRTFAFQPEVRYWLREDNQAFFVGAHFGYASYNIAVDGDLRYQDHNGQSPALGGGISAGYRMPISKDNKWNIEFVLGAGVYGLHYDTFYNTTNGKYVGTYKKTYWGIDNAAINISYSFDLK